MVNSDNICFEICGNIFRRFSEISPVVQAVQTCLLYTSGIPILIAGKICREADWNRIFEVGEDGGFSMGDYDC